MLRMELWIISWTYGSPPYDDMWVCVAENRYYGVKYYGVDWWWGEINHLSLIETLNKKPSSGWFRDWLPNGNTHRKTLIGEATSKSVAGS
jgi:hypothetical protein